MGGDVSLVYVHCAICESYLVKWYSMDILSIGVREVDVCSEYVHCAICETYLV